MSGAKKRKPVSSIYAIVDDRGVVVESDWFGSADAAWECVVEADIEEHCGPVRVFRFAAQEEYPRG